MKSELAIVLTVVLSCVHVYALPSNRGACAIMCSPHEGLYDDLGMVPCPAGFTCQSTGCGALCVLSDRIKDELAMSNKRGACAIMCSPYNGLFNNMNLNPCPSGTTCQYTGCGALSGSASFNMLFSHVFTCTIYLLI